MSLICVPMTWSHSSIEWEVTWVPVKQFNKNIQCWKQANTRCQEVRLCSLHFSKPFQGPLVYWHPLLRTLLRTPSLALKDCVTLDKQDEITGLKSEVTLGIASAAIAIRAALAQDCWNHPVVLLVFDAMFWQDGYNGINLPTFWASATSPVFIRLKIPKRHGCSPPRLERVYLLSCTRSIWLVAANRTSQWHTITMMLPEVTELCYIPSTSSWVSALPLSSWDILNCPPIQSITHFGIMFLSRRS